MKIPNLLLSLKGLTTKDKQIVRVVSMDSETDDVTVLVRHNVQKEGSPLTEYKIILPIGKALNILGYFKDEIREVIEERKDVTIKKQVVVKDENEGEE